MAALVDPILRGVLLFFLAVVLGLTGSLIATQHRVNPQINFGIFSAVFGLVFSVFYGLAAAFVEFLAFPIVIAVLDFLNVVFTFAAATAIAVAIRTHNCADNDWTNKNVVAQGSESRCRKAQASSAFLYLAFFTNLAVLIYSLMAVASHGAFALPSMRKRSPPRTGIPTMSQV